MNSDSQLTSKQDQAQLLFQVQREVELLQKKINLLRELERNKQEIKRVLEEIQKRNFALSSKYSLVREERKRIKEKERLLLNEGAVQLSHNQILEYHSKIMNFMTLPEDYLKTDKFLPWSFAFNKIDNSQIEESSLYYRYKNNPFYNKLNVPSVEYVQNTQKNVVNYERKSQLKSVLLIKNTVHIKLKPPQYELLQERKFQLEQINVIYTRDGSIPTLQNSNKENWEVIVINKNTTLKLRAVCLGFIESEVYELDIKVQGTNNNNEYTNEIDRPLLMSGDDSIEEKESFSSELDYEIVQNENFVSWHDNNSYATPKD